MAVIDGILLTALVALSLLQISRTQCFLADKTLTLTETRVPTYLRNRPLRHDTRRFSVEEWDIQDIGAEEGREAGSPYCLGIDTSVHLRCIAQKSRVSQLRQLHLPA
ncbi:hypothetical protein GE21DRAFT_1050714 [Neurospora crassa]|nr:hypothetical protein GE21DRAFT_1050714 [Neurospora crassa]